MRDIRYDLGERIEVTVKQRTEVSERLRDLEAREQHLRALLLEEEVSHARPQQLRLPSLPESSDGTRLREFVLGSLEDGHDWSLQELKEHALGIGLTTVGALGRSLNIVLVTLHRQGRLERLPNGRWQFRNHGSQLALPLARPSADPDPGIARIAS